MSYVWIRCLFNLLNSFILWVKSLDASRWQKMKQARPQKETKTNFLAHGSLLSSDWLSGSFWHASATKNPTVHLITARPESIFNGRQQRKRDRGWREEGSKAEREGTAVAMECGKSTKWWQWRICSSSTLLFKGLFPFHFTGSHFTSKNLCVFGECVGEFCVCGVNASRSAWRRGCAGQAC